MARETTAVLEWQGKEYTLKYRFEIVRRLREEGISIPKIYRAIVTDKHAAMEYGDDIAATIAWLLRDAGAENVTDEDVWRECMGDESRLKVVMALFGWVCAQHFASSDLAPKVAPPAKKPVARKKAAKKK